MRILDIVNDYELALGHEVNHVDGLVTLKFHTIVDMPEAYRDVDGEPMVILVVPSGGAVAKSVFVPRFAIQFLTGFSDDEG